jgi:AcrR family transcriptional regulator
MPIADPSTGQVARPRKPGRPRGGQVLVDREQLLQAAERLIREEGPDITMDAIAAASTVTKPIVYRSVGDRDALVAALAERFIDRINTTAGIALARARTPRTRVRALVATYMEIVHADPNMYLFVTAGGTNTDRVADALRLADRSAHPLAAELRAHQGDGRLGASLALTWSYALIGALHYTALWAMRENSTDSDVMVDQITDLLWSGIGSPRPASRSQRGAG